MAAHWEPLPVYAQLLRPTRAHVVAGLGQFVRMFRTLGVVQSLQFVGAARHLGRRRKRELRENLATKGITGVRKVISSGNSVTASCQVGGGPAAVIAWFAPRSRTLVQVKIYADQA